MTDDAQSGLGSDPWPRMASEDLRALAWLHAHERSPQNLAALYASGFPASLTLVAPDNSWLRGMDAALCALSGASDDDGLAPSLVSSEDELAADFAAIYLTHALRASPHESVWRDEDHLMLQEPTFAVRAFYRRHGVHVTDWRQCADDYLATELEFVALLLERGELKEAARFFKAHLLTWLPLFAKRVSQRAATPFYAALAGLTLTACENCAARLPAVAVLPPVVADPGASRHDGDCAAAPR
ncbi:MAG: molecular chaperone TorD family protein [Burkholderiaceae bacterium]|jgi:TorA maturation chaperone TorD|nr:molecular chaperone TorD family protein [Burkholderiaceae bacterium]